jgi:DNA-binding GntR family transcriptional regulator
MSLNVPETTFRSGRSSEIRATLLDEIESGRLPPGSALDERSLAERFGVSRTPVREALLQLAARDLVRITPRQGAEVARMSVNQVRGLMETLAELEAFAARLAARRVDTVLKERLAVCMERCEKAAALGGSGEYALANSSFHEAIFKGSRNDYLAGQLRAAHRLIQRYRSRDFQTAAQINRSLNDHVAIVKAICEGDENAAAEAMRLHVPAGSTGFSEFLATVPPTFFEAEPA